MDGKIVAEGPATAQPVQVAPGVYQLDLKRGEEVVLKSMPSTGR